ncbi:MAG: protein kinase, partial [Planctomycetales bacterium]
MMAVPSVEEFLDALDRAKLFRPEELQQLRDRLPADSRDASARALANVLVKRGLLTYWQSRQLIQGRTDCRVVKYMLLDFLGQGAFGEVFKARATMMDRDVALKGMGRQVTPASLKRFLREIEVLSKLTHRNIVRLYDAFEDSDR